MLTPENSLCPTPCKGTVPGDWTVYNSVESLSYCQEPMMFDFSIMNPLDDPETIVQIRACTASKMVKSSTKQIHEAPAAVGNSISTAQSAWWLPTIEKHNVAVLIEKIQARAMSQDARGIIQVCGGNRTSDYTTGLVSSGDGNLVFVQHAVKSWAKASCAPTAGASGTKAIDHLNCGTSPSGFTKNNSYNKKLCSTLMEGQVVCCSAGSLPDIRPKPKANGECATHDVDKNESCSSIAAFNGLKITDLDEFNKETWGWNGCKNLLLGQKICTSKGSPPLPAPVSNAQCGPTKPGTKMPTGNKKLADLNPCPLKACCNIWGQCGTTKDYCTISKSTTGNPGTSKSGENGCISNCGMKIVNNEKAPDSFKKIAYYESWNQDRPCMHMDVRTITSAFTSGWTHVHFAFANITSDYKVSVKDTYGQFKNFKSLKGIKRIIAFGGWSFSVGVDTYTILREAVKPANREAFANEVVRFVKDHDLDGVDFDWEYPGAPDLPDIPKGSLDEPANYLKFLQLVKSKLPSEKTLSIAAPASFWYLKQFPIATISRTVDYIVYMTYDLHGQWDYESAWASDGCPKGSCLRSHVNLTETENSLAMVTKAGVEARKLVVGVSSYGRSFKMSSARCKGPMCTFTGPESGAAKGKCTDTAGYISNAELEALIHSHSGDVEKWHDATTDSDYMIFDDTNWVAYMSEKTKQGRTAKYKSLNFGGTSDWAIDLQEEWADTHNVDGDDNDEDEDDVGWESFAKCNEKYNAVDDIPSSTSGRCVAPYVLGSLSKELAIAVKDYKEVSKGYDDKFKWYVDWVKEGINTALDTFMKVKSGEGNKYMDCEWTSPNSKGSGPCTDVELRVPINTPKAANRRFITYKMRDEKGFYEALLANHGIEKSWVEWKDYADHDICICPNGPHARGVDEKEPNRLAAGPPCPCEARAGFTMHKNYPRRIQDTSKIDVPNPKSIIDEAIPKTDELAELLSESYIDALNEDLDASSEDAVTAFSMPVFMLEDAIESIKKVKEIGEKQKETKTRELVLSILSIVFAVIPFAGSAASALGGAAMIARAALIIGEAGSAALSIVDIVEDPASAPFAILGMLIGSKGVKVKGPRKAFKDAADARRALKDNKLEAFSQEFRRKDKIVQSLLKKSNSCSVA
ncbi:Killer toxin subunits alpha/beta [Fusarium oxysporum f. sp. raphani]|uniref:Killer toxin subunits alpha/beta n=1 Tax=Fusarium oxysporum f. sp. raphani TaxID=96318 RepID=A0A8J5PTK4_FUSOX|nr:Killer toxin subunits alpha/beta [Fusarium oxysporum f. sp. raphani]